MRLYHVTVKANRSGIMVGGIDPSYSKGARAECWYVIPSLLAWAIIHVMRRHKCGLKDVVGLEVLIPERKLTRRRRGIFTCSEVVEALYVVEEIEAEGVADSYPSPALWESMQGG